MIKRPFLWILGAYLVGMLLAWFNVSKVYMFTLGLLSLLIIYTLMYIIQNRFVNRLDGFLWCLPLLLTVGYLAMKGQMLRPELDQVFEDKVDCRLSGTITMIVTKQWGKVLYVTDNSIMLSEGEQEEGPFLCENVIVYSSDNQNYLVGNSITVYGEIQKFSKATNPGQFNEYKYYEIENIDYKLMADQIHITDYKYSKFHKILYRLKKRMIEVYDTILSDREAGSLIAMLLGEKYLLDDEVKELYQENGISHILSISGLHVSLIGICIYNLFRKLRVPIITATIASIVLIYSYGIFTNFSVSTNRAVVMLIVNLLAKIFGKTYDMLSATSLSAFLILLNNPMQLFSVGFQLSFAAVIGIAVLIPCLQEIFPSKNIVIENIYVSLAAQLITMPLILYYFYQLPIYSLVINLLLVPFMSILIISSLIAGIAGIIYMPLGIFLIGSSNYILILYECFCRFGSALPGNLVTIGQPELYKIIIYYVLLLIFVWGVKRYGNKGFSLALLAGTILLLLPRSIVGMEITMLDVGQGEAIFIEMETGTNYLIDGGSTNVKKVGEYRIIPYLLSQGVDEIDYSIITHSDSDHISGLIELMSGDEISIRNLVIPNIPVNDRDDNYIKLVDIAEDRGISVLYIEAGNNIQDGDLTITCLHPAQTFHPSSNNAYSTVLSFRYGEFDMLLTGDLENDGENILMDILQGENRFYKEAGITVSENSVAIDYDVLKVAHHGSKYSSDMSFLQLVKPELSLISCGKNNIYGHPHKELLERLETVGSSIYNTVDSGAITIKTDGKWMEIEEFLDRHNKHLP